MLSGRTALMTALVIGAAVAVVLGVYGSVHDPTGRSLVTLFFTETINLKVWLATVAVAFASFQLWSALRMYGRLGSQPKPSWLPSAHRWSGTAAFVVSIPVAYHCLWALGFQSGDGARILVHSLLGCVFYGAFVTKVLLVRSSGTPNWTLPLVGGLTFSVLVGVWFSSSLWFFTTQEFPGI